LHTQTLKISDLRLEKVPALEDMPSRKKEAMFSSSHRSWGLLLCWQRLPDAHSVTWVLFC